MKNLVLMFVVLLFSISVSLDSANAHHGWKWTTGKNIELFGIIKTVSLGNPHGVLTVDAEGDVWTVEVGQPWRNQRAGLKAGDLSVGVEVKIIGEPSENLDKKRMKAERILIGEKVYVLYPDRD